MTARFVWVCRLCGEQVVRADERHPHLTAQHPDLWAVTVDDVSNCFGRRRVDDASPLSGASPWP
jgi:hypothetical protein